MSSVERILGFLVLVALLVAGCSGDDALEGGCLDSRIDEENLGYIERWSTTESLHSEQCVLPGVHGPEPSTVPEGLGAELPLHPESLPSGDTLPQSVLNPIVDFYPIIHVGQVGDTDRHAFLYWARDSQGGPSPNIGGALAGPGATMADQPGIWSIGTDENLTLGEIVTIDIYVVVPEEAAVAALAIDDQPYARQRPVAKVAVFVIDGAELESQLNSITVTVYDESGAEIDAYEEQLD